MVKGATAVPNYIKANKSYSETYNKDAVGDGPTYYADWSNKELLWFYKQFYTDFAAKYDHDPRIAFVQAGFGHWGEYHIYGTTLELGKNFATKDYQAEFLTHLDSLFKETPWSISIDVAGNKTLLALNFGLFDDSFMHKEHDISQGNGDNERNWRDLGTDRWKTAPGGGEVSYYTEKDQREFLNPAGLYGVTWEDAAAKYHMTYVIGNDAPEGSYATKDRVYEASSYAGYKFEITGYAVNGISAAVRVKDIGIAPLYHNAYVTVNGVRSEKSLKGLLPGDKLLKGATIPYKANLSASAEVIAGLLDENGTTAIAGARSLTHDKGKGASKDASNLGKTRSTDLKGRNVPGKAAKGAYYPISKH